MVVLCPCEAATVALIYTGLNYTHTYINIYLESSTFVLNRFFIKILIRKRIIAFVSVNLSII